jgi:aromatic-L-amino-acid/L-tryptophan decarboxylase
VDSAEFRFWSKKAAEWGVEYRASLRERPVRAQTRPGEIAARIPPRPPDAAEPMAQVFADFEQIILPGVTHWQHPRFFAYFPANAAPASVVAEYLVAAMSAQCMLWQTSPAATELETRVVDWLRQAVGLPESFVGSIQDSASTGTLVALLTIRERALGWRGNREGSSGQRPVRVYASDQVHSSIDRAVWIAGIGADNLVRIPTTGSLRSMDAAALDAAIVRDRDAGLLPAGVVACVGGTSVGATDDLEAVCAVAERHGLPVHVDAAWAGSAMICPEFRDLWFGIERADSVVINPHKWLGAQFDCSLLLTRHPEHVTRTLAIRPEYLTTPDRNGVVDYSEWTIPLGRRFRALKLWFLIRAYGLDGLRAMIRDHVRWSAQLAERIAADPQFEVVTAPVLSLFSFRFAPPDVPEHERNALNLALLNAINEDGRIYLTQTTVDDRIAIRFQAGQFETTEQDVAEAFMAISDCAGRLASAQGLTPDR